MQWHSYDSWEIEPHVYIDKMSFYSGMCDITYYEAIIPNTNKRKLPIPAIAKVHPYKNSSCVETNSACYYISGDTQVTFYNTDNGVLETNKASRGWTDLEKNAGRAMFPDSNGYIINSYSGYVERLCINNFTDDPNYEFSYEFLDNTIDSNNGLQIKNNTTSYIFVVKGSVEVDGVFLEQYDFGRITTEKTLRNVLLNFIEQDTILAVIHKKVL